MLSQLDCKFNCLIILPVDSSESVMVPKLILFESNVTLHTWGRRLILTLNVIRGAVSILNHFLKKLKLPFNVLLKTFQGFKLIF